MDLSQIKSVVDKTQTDLTAFVANARSELNEYKSAIGTLQSRIEELGKQGGVKHKGFDPAAEIARKIIEAKADFEKFRRVSIEAKSVLTSSGLTVAQPSGAVGLYEGGAHGAIRALFRVVPTDSGSVFQIEETAVSGWTDISPQTESAPKSEVTANLTGRTLTVATIPAWIKVSRQAMDDAEGLSEYIRGRLIWALNREIDGQVLSGDGTGTNLRGLTTAAQAFDASVLTAFANYGISTVIGAAAAQLATDGFAADFVILNPLDAFKARFERASTGEWVGLPPLPRIVESNLMSAGDFVVGDSGQAVIRSREMARLDVSESDSDNFTRNLLTLRIEERLALQIVSANAFCYGTLTTSPA